MSDELLISMTSQAGAEFPTPQPPSQSIESIVGARVRHFRLQMRLTLDQLAQRVGLTKGQISKVENGLVSSPLSTIASIAKALQVDVATLTAVVEPENKFNLITNEQRKQLPVNEIGPGLVNQSLLGGNATGKTFVPYFYTIKRKGWTNDRHFFRHPGEAFIYMLSGIIEFAYRDDFYSLKMGDSAYFDGSEPSGPARVLESPVQYIMVVGNPAVE
jgi:transcriptional regulator with XRE-family HTH domain